jgi:hypothetical protein
VHQQTPIKALGFFFRDVEGGLPTHINALQLFAICI